MTTLHIRNDTIQHGDLSALVCVDQDALAALLVDEITPLGFGIHTALTQEEAYFRMQAHRYELIVIHERFAGADAESNPAIIALNDLPLNVRRGACVIVIGPSMESRSEMQAFLYGVNLVLQEGDMTDFRQTVGQAIIRQEQFYSAFHAVQKRVQEV